MSDELHKVAADVHRDHDLVFNVVWTGTVFRELQVFVSSLIDHSGARFRFVANACPVEHVRAMERYAARFPDRVVEVLPVSWDRMIGHGLALDRVLASRDDGELFCLVDTDVAVKGPYLPRFLELLADHDAISSGKEVWSSDNIRPAEHPGVNGEFFFDADGFVFGSPHFAVYRSAALRETIERWNIGFGSPGNDLAAPTRARLEELGRSYWVYDTGKIVNILLQGDGRKLCHEDRPELLHVGGVAHFLAPPSSVLAAQGKPVRWGEGDDWGRQPGMVPRWTAARYTADVVRAELSGGAVPPVPPETPPVLHERLTSVRDDLIGLVDRYGPATPWYVEVPG